MYYADMVNIVLQSYHLCQQYGSHLNFFLNTIINEIATPVGLAMTTFRGFS